MAKSGKGFSRNKPRHNIGALMDSLEPLHSAGKVEGGSSPVTPKCCPSAGTMKHVPNCTCQKGHSITLPPHVHLQVPGATWVPRLMRRRNPCCWEYRGHGGLLLLPYLPSLLLVPLSPSTFPSPLLLLFADTSLSLLHLVSFLVAYPV